MKILGIDYGRKKIGLAIADNESKLPQPYLVFRVKSEKEILDRLERIVADENIEKIVVGVSDAEIGEESKKFGILLKSRLRIDIDYQDETLSTQDAIRMSIEAGIGKKKRKRLEDAYAATLILQEYLDS